MRLSRFILSSAVCASMLLAGCAKNGGDEPKTYTVTVTSGGNGEAKADKTTAAEGETVTLTAENPADGYTFDKWTVVSGSVTCSPGESSNPATFTMPAGNVSVKAMFVEIPSYTVSVTKAGNGTAAADKTTAKAGETVKLTAEAANGYHFYKWTAESGGITLSDPAVNPATFIMPAENVTVRAEFLAPINGLTWAAANVNTPGTFADNPEDVGMYYKWGTKIGWSSTDPIVNSDGNTEWNSVTYPETVGEDWPADNDPCPAGWRIPLRDEFTSLAEYTTDGWTELNGVNGYRFTDEESVNSVFFCAAGNRGNNYEEGKNPWDVTMFGSVGYYWSATPFNDASSNAHYMLFSSYELKPTYQHWRSSAFLIRCVAK